MTKELNEKKFFIIEKFKGYGGDRYSIHSTSMHDLTTAVRKLLALDTLEEDIVLSIICFDKVEESCIDSDNSLVEVVFTVDMQQEELSENGVYILGTNEDFTNFGYDIITGDAIAPYDPTTTSLTEIEEDVYKISIHLEPSKSYQYKFINGNDLFKLCLI